MRFVRAATVAALAVLIAACDDSRPAEETSQTFECLRCHGYPPPPFVAGGTTHPANADCSLCHPATVEADDVTLVPGGPHMNGLVERTGGHAPGYADPAVHGPDAFDSFAGETGAQRCIDCHGEDYGGGTGPSCTGCHTGAGFADWLTNCTFCHGIQTPGWTSAQLAAAAPPEGVLGENLPTNPRVGAHQAHLGGDQYSAGFACGTCHTVPANITHITNSVEVVFTPSGELPPDLATFTPANQTCTSYCHGSTLTAPAPTPQWTTTALACDACHALPPASGPTAGGVLTPNAHEFHVAAGASCQTCHATTLNVGGTIDTAGGRHVNGVKNADAATAPPTQIVGWDCAACHTALGVPAATHAVPYPTHTADALAGIGACAGCHGTDYGGGLGGLAPSCNDCHAAAVTASAPDWKTNCTFCHGTRTAGVTTATTQAAPPDAVVSGGDQTNANPKVGAHQAHLNPGTYSAGFACTTCHPVPTTQLALSHFSGGGAPATVAFDPLASQGAGTPTYTGGSCAVYCHGNGTSWPAGSVAATPTPAWTLDGIACNACHASRPVTGGASGHGSADTHVHRTTTTGDPVGTVKPTPCSYCHLGYAQDTTTDATIHVNGQRTVRFNDRTGGVTTLANPGWGTCDLCHNATTGNVNAPPF